jgi:hypothetical protein
LRVEPQTTCLNSLTTCTNLLLVDNTWFILLAKLNEYLILFFYKRQKNHFYKFTRFNWRVWGPTQNKLGSRNR